MGCKKGHIPWNKGKTGVQTHSKEARDKIRIASTGRRLSEEVKKKLSEMKTGRHLSEETKRKLSEINKGKHHSDETKRKIGEAGKGRINSEETKHKRSESLKQAYINNPELKINISKIHKGKTVSKESREKVSKAHTGIKLSMEHRKRLSEARIGFKPTKETLQKRSEYNKSHPESYEKLLLLRIQRPTKPQLKLFNIICKLYSTHHIEIEWKVKTKKGVKFMDVAIPELMLGFEYDEPYWHQDKEKDNIRHQLIEAEGWKLTHYSKESDFPISINT